MERRDDGTQHTSWKERTLEGTIPKIFDDELAGGLHHWVPSPQDAFTAPKPMHYGIENQHEK
jgi:dihydropyrimidine dehydrogenase (NAD+) subunit PreA